jgi:hypothetical protein
VVAHANRAARDGMLLERKFIKPPIIRDSRVRWEIVWLLCSSIIAVAANFYTGAPVLDLTLAHIVIALITGLIPTALIFGIVEAFVFIRGVAKG